MKNQLKIDKPEQTNKIITTGEDLIQICHIFQRIIMVIDMRYFLEYGVFNPEKSNLILMDKVTAIVYLSNGEKFIISSDKADYNEEIMIQLLVVQ